MDFITNYFDGHNNDRNARFLSFDICRKYFIKHRGVASKPENINESVMTLWGYLTSWGMLRGAKCALHNKNPYYLKNAISVIDKYEKLFDVDLPDYHNAEGLIVSCYEELARSLTIESTKPTQLLVTKIMFGVFSCIPATDVNVRKYFKGKGSLNDIQNAIKTFGAFYETHKEQLKPRMIETSDWNGKSYERLFNSARLLDMYAYVNGQNSVNNE